MGIKERKEREWEERRELILDAANKIISLEGIDSLSIRKIAGMIEYSPSVIYHYFNSKDDIINLLMEKNYQRILGMLSPLKSSDGSPEEKLREASRRYIDMALQRPEEYKAILLNGSPGILEHTSVLFKGASKKRQAVGMLCRCLKDIYKNADDYFIELTAQVVWAATFGLIMRLIIEKDIDEKQKSNLIEHQIKCIVDGMIMGRPLYNNKREVL